MSVTPLPFAEILGELNVFAHGRRAETFGRIVIAEAQSVRGGAKILDVGCGTGLGVGEESGESTLRAIKAVTSEYWGCEPDPAVKPSGLLDHCLLGTLETAKLPDNYFDILYAHYVVEHVAQPGPFMRRAYELLKVGGKFVFITPNSAHYFVRIARIVAALNLEVPILKLLHPGAAAAHYPTRYLLNDPSAIEAYAAEAGFSRCDFAYLDHGDLRGYFPRGLQWIPLELEKSARRNADPTKLPAMVARLTK